MDLLNFGQERNHWGCEGYRCVEYSLATESFLRKANAWTICPQQSAVKESTDSEFALALEIESESPEASTRTSPGADDLVSTDENDEGNGNAASALEQDSFINSELIPENSVVDMNIGTNFDPIVAKPGTHRILVDPLFYVCGK